MISYEEFREYLKHFNPENVTYAKWYSLTREESEKAKKHLLEIKAINWKDEQNESTLHSLIQYFKGRPQFAETAMVIEIAADPIISAVREKVDNE